MELADLLKPDRVVVGLRAGTKPQLLQDLGRRAAAAVGVDAAKLTALLAAREKLGSTGLGKGFALPHARVEGIGQLFGMLIRLARPIEFEAIDNMPVDLVFLLLVPADSTNAHVAALSAVSRQMRDQTFTQRVRKAETAEALYSLLVSA